MHMVALQQITAIDKMKEKNKKTKREQRRKWKKKLMDVRVKAFLWEAD